jgi:hypothetical protein
MDPQNDSQFGHIHWRSTLTGVQGAGQGVHLPNPAEVVSGLNLQFPGIIHHWVPFGPKSSESQP